MRKRITYTILIISLIAFLPAFSGNAAVPPTLLDDTLTPDSVYEYDGNTIEIIEETDTATTILLNDTYELTLVHTTDHVSVVCTELDSGLVPQADEMVFDVDFTTDETGQTLDVVLPDLAFQLSSSGPNNDEWNTTILGSGDPIDMSYNSTTHDFWVSDSANTIEMIAGVLYINGGAGPTGMMISRMNETTWDIFTPHGLITVNFNAGAGYLHVDYFGGASPGTIYDGVFPPTPLPIPMYVDPIIAIDFDGNSVTIGYAGVSICIQSYMLVLVFDYISITWFFGAFIERLVILIWDLTIILYIAIVELLIVIIYYTFEIKIYETQIVIVYEYIEIIFLFISIIIWELTFIFHFEFWFIQLIFIIDIIINIIIQPVRFIFIPILIPIFIPIIFYVPVVITNYIHIYLPYASPALYIDIVQEDLQMPTHTMQYKVTDQAGLEIEDATVTIDYNGTIYHAAHLADGVYEIALPASTELETIDVTAEKPWYPDAKLTYTLDVDWIIDTVTNNVTQTITADSSIALTVVSISVVSVLLGFILYRRKRRD